MLCTYVCNIFDYISGVHLNEEKVCIIIHITKNGQKSSHNGFDLISLPLFQVGNHKNRVSFYLSIFSQMQLSDEYASILNHNFLQRIRLIETSRLSNFYIENHIFLGYIRNHYWCFNCSSKNPGIVGTYLHTTLDSYTHAK